ncbi:NAD(P)/FAD-dependent oxidoreductase, partial [Marinobacter nauticus]|uniref:NAD(P)/FAD-dependent oxidoreductase n=1 Tax=Marinobacter nauticus TaxID=2743 RepID=UPI003D6CDDB7
MAQRGVGGLHGGGGAVGVGHLVGDVQVGASEGLVDAQHGGEGDAVRLAGWPRPEGGLVVEEVIGDNEPKNVKSLKIKNLKTNKIDEIKIDGLFIAIGHDPATSLFKEQLEMDKEGYLITKPDSTETNIPGVYAAGDVKDKTFRQAV